LKKPTILIVGLDAATFDLIGPWVAGGKLPNLEALMKNGAWARLTSILAPADAKCFDIRSAVNYASLCMKRVNLWLLPLLLSLTASFSNWSNDNPPVDY
jgi:hypothetical protein